jgi:TP901 family phage tail tape measure protein
MIKPVQITVSSVDKFSSGFNSAIKSMDALGKKAKAMGSAMSMGFSLPMFAASAAAFKMSTDLNSAMANVATMIPNNIGRIQELKTVVQDLSIETGKMSTNIAEGLYQTVSAFQDSADTAKILSINTKAAVAGVTDVKNAINLTSSVTQVWGDMSASAVQKVADFGFQTAFLGKTTFPELAASMSNVTLPAHQLNVSMNEMFAAMAHSSNITNNTATSSTQFASALREMLNPSKELTQLFDHLDYKSGPDMIKGMGGIVPTMQKIVDLSKAVDVPLQKFLGRSEAMMFALQFTGESGQKFTNVLKQMSDSSIMGASDRAFKEQTEGINKIGFSFSQSMQRMIVFGQKFGDAIAPMIDGVIKFGTPIVNWLTSLDPLVLKVGGSMGLMAASIGGALVAFSGVAAAIATISWPVAAVVGGLTLLAGAAVLIHEKWTPIKQFFRSTLDFVGNIFKSRIGQFVLLTNPITVLPTLIINNWSKLGDTIKNVFGTIKSTISSVNTWLEGTPFFKFLKATDGNLMSGFGDLGNAGQSAMGFMGKVGEWLLSSNNNDGFYADPAGPKLAPALNGKKTEKLEVVFSNLPAGAQIIANGKTNYNPNRGQQALTW